MDDRKKENLVGWALVLYIAAMGIAGIVFIVFNLPVSKTGGSFTFPKWLHSLDNTLVVLAMVAGLSGSFVHSAQSLSSYLGNQQFRISWTAWYLLRPWIGAILGLTVYFALRAGLIAGASTPSPYGVVALGLLAGWFSKTTADKLQEVFETLFKTDEDKDRKDKLKATKRPVIEAVQPVPVPAGHNALVIQGQNFMDGAKVVINSHKLQAQFVSDRELKVSLDNFAHRPVANSKGKFQVENPKGSEPLSEVREIEFQ